MLYNVFSLSKGIKIIFLNPNFFLISHLFEFNVAAAKANRIEPAHI